MNLVKISFYIFFIFLQATQSFAQSSIDTIQQLKTVEVSSCRLNNYSSGNKSETLDSNLLNRYSTNNLADILANESQVFIKSYGLGSLATLSFRGSGANHTAVLWNGFNLQSPMNGVLDVSLVPAVFLSDVKLQYGGAGALWGSGAVGGSIHLNNSSQYDKGVSAFSAISFGSFADKQQQAFVEISKKRFVTSLKIMNHDAKNNFPFINTAQNGNPQQKQTNAELQQYGFLQENYIRINKRQKINTRFWYQFTDRNIPPSMTQNINVSNQKDEFYRGTMEWQRTGKKMLSTIRAAYFDEYLFYADSIIDLKSKSRSTVFIIEAENKFSITKLDELNIGINNTNSKAFVKEYSINPVQNRFAVFVNYKIHTSKNKWNAFFSARQEFIDKVAAPFTSSLGFDGKFFRYFIIKGNAAQHYRIPTFNDLYWAQGGNPDLKAEKGWSEEMSLIHKHSYKKFDWELGATAFNRTIDNWIIWLPNQYGLWTPENVLKVWSRGVEYKLNADYSIKKFRVHVSGMYNYVLSTNAKSETLNDITIGKQLIYVPIQNAQGNIVVSLKGMSISYTQIYTGYRYTTSDNTSYLKPYSIGNITISQNFLMNTSKIKVYAQINNVWKETYQVLAYRAMPLLNYQFGFTLYFNQPNNL